MGVITISDEMSSPVSPARIFKASVLDAHNLIPKILSDKVKGVEVQGDGGAGTIKKIIFAEDAPFPFIKQRIDELDEKNFKIKLTIIEGPLIGEKLEKVVDTVQAIASADGGSICKGTSEFYTIGDNKLSEEEIQKGKEMLTGTFKAVEAYLLQNPDAYA